MKPIMIILTSILSLGLCACSPPFVRENEKAAAFYLQKNPSASRTIAGPRPLHYVTGGTPGKPKIIFVHGSPGSWDAFVRYLSDSRLATKAYLITVDRPGYGASGSGTPEDSLQAQASLLEKLYDIDDPRAAVHLVGHSYGGPVVAKMAMDADPRLTSILILAGSVDPTLERKKWFQYPADWFFVRWMMPSSLDVCNQEIEALQGELKLMLPLWSKIKADITVIQGQNDDLVAPANADFIKKHAAQVHPEVIRIPGLNHFVPWLKKDLVTEVLLRQIAPSKDRL